MTDAAGSVVGKGITGLSSDDLRLVAGRKTAAVREILPDAGAEVIHRDQFVLADPPDAG